MRVLWSCFTTFGWTLDFTPKAISSGEQWATVRDCRDRWNARVVSWTPEEEPPAPSYLLSQCHMWISLQNKREKGAGKPASLSHSFTRLQLDDCPWHSRSPWRQSQRGSPSSLLLCGPIKQTRGGRRLIPHLLGHVDEVAASQRLGGKGRKKRTEQGSHVEGVSAWWDLKYFKILGNQENIILWNYYTHFLS